ncbi:MAG: CCA tRNA nucleotidyltransferase [Pseudomonadota bacterium]
MAEARILLDPVWPWPNREDVRDFCALLDGDATSGTQARLVGGAVRDALLGIAASDIDIATPHSPERVQAIAEKAGIKSIPTGIDHGTVTVILASGPVEVTTLRRDVSTDGRHATIVFSEDWREDAGRRDFTFNALYAEPQNGRVHDYFGGLDDLKVGRLRFIGNARTRIEEDYLRILRLFRFHARFGREAIDPELIALCREMGPTLKALSRERISGELLRLIMADGALEAMRAMAEAALWPHILPELTDNGFADFARLIGRAQHHGVSVCAMTRLATLLPRQRDAIDRIAARLRLANADREWLRQLATITDSDLSEPRALAYRFGRDMALEAELLLAGDNLCQKAVEALHEWYPPAFPVSGRDIIRSGIDSGPDVGKALHRLENVWIEAGFPEIDDIEAFVSAYIGNIDDRS